MFVRSVRHFVCALTLCAVFFGFAPGLSMPEAEASWWSRVRDAIQRALDRYERRGGGGGGGGGSGRAVPELDPSSAGQALILVAGGAYLIARRRRASD